MKIEKRTHRAYQEYEKAKEKGMDIPQIMGNTNLSFQIQEVG